MWTNFKKYIDILKKEVVPALGCTEPIAVALAAAKAKETLGKEADKVEVYVSPNIFKNGFLADDIQNYAMAVTAAASDARMAGCMNSVMSNSGSGNQGITVILPVVAVVLGPAGAYFITIGTVISVGGINIAHHSLLQGQELL